MELMPNTIKTIDILSCFYGDSAIGEKKMSFPNMKIDLQKLAHAL
jgi:hypothetical protein